MGQAAPAVACSAFQGQQAVLLACLAPVWRPSGTQLGASTGGEPLEGMPRLAPHTQAHPLTRRRGGGGACSALPLLGACSPLLGGTGCSALRRLEARGQALREGAVQGSAANAARVARPSSSLIGRP